MTTSPSTEHRSSEPDATEPRSAHERQRTGRGGGRELVPRPWIKRAGYSLTQSFLMVGAIPLFQLRCFGRANIPPTGPVLVCSNHQSVIDPLVLGTCIGRPMNYLARNTLFHIPLLASLMRFYDTIPIQREGMGIEGIKETLLRLRRQEMVLIFPEGTRTRTGEVAPLKRGFCAIARRAHAAILPVALDGAFAAWPRGAVLPRLSPIEVQIGPPLSSQDVATTDDETLVTELERRIRSCHSAAEARLRRGGPF